MASQQFPKLPGYSVLHDPTLVAHKKVSHVKLEKVRNAKNQDVPLYSVPKPPQRENIPEKNAASTTFSQSVFQNHFANTDI